MDKVQIIINDIDVSGCEFLIINRDRRLCRCTKFNYFGDAVCPKNAENLNCQDNYNCYFKQLARQTQECEQIQEKYEALKLENQEGYEIVDELKQKCEELEKANLHIDTNRLRKEKKLKRIEDLIFSCETCETIYTDEFTQKICSIIQEPEPTIDGYDIITRYRKALEEIETATKINCEEICGRKFADCNDTSCFSADILDIISRAKGEE